MGKYILSSKFFILSHSFVLLPNFPPKRYFLKKEFVGRILLHLYEKYHCFRVTTALSMVVKQLITLTCLLRLLLLGGLHLRLRLRRHGGVLSVVGSRSDFLHLFLAGLDKASLRVLAGEGAACLHQHQLEVAGPGERVGHLNRDLVQLVAWRLEPDGRLGCGCRMIKTYSCFILTIISLKKTISDLI